MNTARFALSLVAVLLLTAGYVGSQMAALTGQTEPFLRRLDDGPIPILAGVLLVGAIVLAFVRDVPEKTSEAFEESSSK